MKASQLRARRPSRLRHRLEALETRALPAGNLHALNAYLTDASNVAEPTPVTGQMIYVRTNWSAIGLVNGDFYQVRVAVDGVPLEDPGPPGQPGSYSFPLSEAGWYA